MSNATANNSPVSVSISTLPGDASTLGVSEDPLTEEQLMREELDQRRALPWWKRPSPWWFLILTPSFASMPTFAGMPPKFELVNQIVCHALRPEYAAGSSPNGLAPDPKLCGADPVVQAAVTRLLTALTMTTGILGCLTTAWWGSRSDRKGRLYVARVTSFGMLAYDIVFVLVFSFSARVKGGYWLLVLGTALQGLAGGLSAMTGGIYAYISDCTEPAKRSGMFSIFLGAHSAGVAVGPIISSIIVRYTHDPLNVFYFMTVAHVAYAFIVWFVVPESLTKAGLFIRMFQFLEPLLLLLPKRVKKGVKTRTDFNLAILGLCYGLMFLMSACTTYSFQYAMSFFGWTSEILGYWMSVIGTSQMVFLMLVFPAIIAVSQRTPSPKTRNPIDPESEPLLPKPPKPEHHTSSIDLTIARVSSIISLVSYFCVACARTGGLFTVATLLDTFGGGSYPALQSLALAMYISGGGTESGSLFGALSMVQVLCAQVVGPTLFGITYSKTSTTLPTTMFFVCSAIAFCMFLLLAFVRLPKVDEDKSAYAEQEVEAELAHGHEEIVI